MKLQPDMMVIDEEQDFRVHTSAYVDPAIFDLEMERVFEQTWVYVAHESEIPLPGDFRTSAIGIQPVIVSRGPDGSVSVLLNRCRHRGSIVCREERGRTAQFRCPYHGWTYRVDGPLLGIAQADGYPEAFDKSALGLASVARVAIYRGLIFASLAPDGEPLEERLDQVRKYVDIWADRSPSGRITLTQTMHRYGYPGNWKLQMDNGVDGYHGNYAHESFVKLMERAEETSFDQFANLRRTGYTRGLSHGDGLIDRPYGGMAGQFDYLDPSLTAYHALLDERYGPERAAALKGQQNLFVFPNLFLFEGHVRVIRPISHDQTIVEMHPFVLEGAPEAINAERLRTHERFFGPAGFGAPDDVEMFINVWSGLKARAVDWLIMSRGLHRESRNADGEYVGASTDEAPQRAAYREWRRLMTANGAHPIAP
jgi:phenylpropionate dioxygenase-like ring-hydroxylating dioxygenase large terminal subunit